METTPDLTNALHAAQAFYRASVRRSWVFQALFDRNLADQLRPAEIGFAPPGWSTTTRALREEGFSDATLLAAGISREGKHGLIDVMRDRMIFPIRDSAAQLLGFVGRARPGADPSVPKYLNSPTTNRYRKHEVLYGAESLSLGDAVWPVIVEGPLDRLAMLKVAQAAQLPLAPLATCGTSLTPDHLRGVRKLNPHPFVIAFDADQSGKSATLRAWDILKAEFPREPHRAIELPDGTDPADLVGNRRRSELLRALSAPKPLENQVATLARGNHALNDVQAVAQLTERVRTDADAVPVAAIAGWICHLGRLYDLPVKDVNEIVLEHVAPQKAVALFQDAPIPTNDVRQSIAERRSNGVIGRLGIER